MFSELISAFHAYNDLGFVTHRRLLMQYQSLDVAAYLFMQHL